MQSYSEIRKTYKRNQLDEKRVPDKPSVLFEQWLNEAMDAGIEEPTAMNLSTVSAEGKPSSRIVLLKFQDGDNFYFFTNYDSRKGRELHDNPNAALLFFWAELERVCRIEGVVEKTDRDFSEKYFFSRPVGSQIGAIVSKQSQPLESRSRLEKEVADFAASGKKTYLPDNWGGYRLKAEYYEFWQGRPDRLHDRITYSLTNDSWIIQRLYP